MAFLNPDKNLTIPNGPGGRFAAFEVALNADDWLTPPKQHIVINCFFILKKKKCFCSHKQS